MCAYNRDWLESNPIDHTKFSAQPGNVRAHKVDISDRLKAMFKGFVSGETQTDEGIIQLPFNVQGSAPGASANKVKVYAKDVSSKAELFVQDEDGDEVQITDGGSLAAAFTAVSVIQTIYPVGSIYVTTIATNPSTVLGFGTWTAFGAGKVMVGIDSGDSDFDTVEETRGSKDVTLTAAQSGLPAHTVAVPGKNGGVSGAFENFLRADTLALNGNIDVSISSANAASSHTNIQPSIVVYLFKRIS